MISQQITRSCSVSNLSILLTMLKMDQKSYLHLTLNFPLQNFHFSIFASTSFHDDFAAFFQLIWHLFVALCLLRTDFISRVMKKMFIVQILKFKIQYFYMDFNRSNKGIRCTLSFINHFPDCYAISLLLPYYCYFL